MREVKRALRQAGRQAHGLMFDPIQGPGLVEGRRSCTYCLIPTQAFVATRSGVGLGVAAVPFSPSVACTPVSAMCTGAFTASAKA